MSEKQNISERLRILRARRHWTQQELGAAMGYDRNYISMVEGGREPGPKFEKQLSLLESSPIGETLTSEHALRVAEEIDASSYGSDPRSLLKRTREAAGLTPEQLGKKAGVPSAYIRQIEAGDVQGSNEKQLRKLAAALKLDPEALMSGSDHPALVGSGITFGAIPPVKTTADIQAKTIPLISMAQAGQLTSYEDVYDREGVIEYARRGPKTFAVRIRGDSMEPRYPDGTIAIVEPDKPLQTERRVITKLRDGSVLFKQLQFTGDTFRLVSLNPIYAPITIGQQDFEWMYRVVRTQREEED